LLFDVTGLIQWYALLSRPTGIQRVAEKLLGSVPIRRSDNVEFVARALGGDRFFRIEAETLSDVARMRAIFAGSLRQARIRPLLLDLEWYHLHHLGIGLLHLERLIAKPPRLEAVPEPGPEDTLFNPGDLWWQRHYAPFMLAIRARTGVRVVQMIHDLIPIERPDLCATRLARSFAAVLGMLAPGVDRWLTNSAFVRGQLATYLAGQSLPAPPIEVLPMGWDSFADQPADDPAVLQRHGIADQPFILCVGTIEPRKNLPTLLDALEELRRGLGARVPRLVVLGSYGWKSPDLAARLRRDPSVVWLKSVSDADLPSFYRGARFTVVPSLIEGWGLPVQESIAHGVPCLASTGGALREAGHGLAVHFDPLDRGALQSALRTWITDDGALGAARARIAAVLKAGNLPTWSDAGRVLLKQADLAA
jgi:glycosyltransferase involved in cell wall biosynthesis